MTSRAEQVIASFEASLFNLQSVSKEKVLRGYEYAIPAKLLPALVIHQGSKSVLGEYGVTAGTVVDVEMNLVVEIHVKSSVDKVDAKCNEIASEVYKAVMSDHTLGLPFVHRVWWSGDGSPLVSNNAETPTAVMEMNWTVMFRHNLLDNTM